MRAPVFQPALGRDRVWGLLPGDSGGTAPDLHRSSSAGCRVVLLTLAYGGQHVKQVPVTG
jgi:hypothetical protein